MGCLGSPSLGSSGLYDLRVFPEVTRPAIFAVARDLKGSCRGDVDIDIDVEVDRCRRGLQRQFRYVKWYESTYGTDFDDAEIARPFGLLAVGSL